MLSQAMSKIVKKAEENAVFDKDDYELNGIIYCHKCHTPKQYIGRVLKGGGFVVDKLPIPCKCKTERDEREKRTREINALRLECIPDVKLHKFTFANDDGRHPDATARAKQYVEGFDEYFKNGKGLLIFGNSGFGKTYLAICIANALIDKGKKCLLADFPTLSNEWERVYGHKNEFLRDLNANDLLIIDDFGVERKSEAVQEMVFKVIDSRLRSGRPMILTTNYTAEELKAPSDRSKERIFSRLYEQSIIIKCIGEDRRKEEFKRANSEFGDQMAVKGL